MKQSKRALGFILTICTAVSSAIMTQSSAANWQTSMLSLETPRIHQMEHSNYVCTDEIYYNADNSVAYQSECVYDNTGVLLKKIWFDDSVFYWAEYIYDNDQIVKETYYYPDGSVLDWIESAYDSANRLIKETYYTSSGEVGYWHTYTYDDANRLTKVTYYDSTGTIGKWNDYTYDSTGKLTEITACNVDGVLGRDVFTYDSSTGRQIQLTSYNANGTVDSRAEWAYDDNGNPIRKTVYTSDGSIDLWVEYRYQDIRDLGNPKVDKVFVDVKASDWFCQPVQYVYDAKLMNGVGDGKFAPYHTVNRAMAVQILYNNATNNDTVDPSQTGQSFSDVSESAWYYDAVQWASANGVSSGYGDGNFHPNDTITREQFIQLLYNDAATPAVSGSISFADASQVSDWAKNSMLWATQNGIVSGIQQSDGSILLSPGSSLTRAESASMLMNYLK